MYGVLYPLISLWLPQKSVSFSPLFACNEGVPSYVLHDPEDAHALRVRQSVARTGGVTTLPRT